MYNCRSLVDILKSCKILNNKFNLILMINTRVMNTRVMNTRVMNSRVMDSRVMDSRVMDIGQ